MRRRPAPEQPSATDRAPVGTARSGPLSDPAFVAGLRPIPSGPVHAGHRHPAHDLTGVDPSGAAVEVAQADRDRPVLVAFLHTRCDGCHEFWRGMAASGPEGGLAGQLWDRVDPVVVTRGPGTVDADEVAALAASADGVTRVPVVMSDRAWTDYRVTGYPFFVLVDPVGGVVVGETVGFGWSDVAAMVHSTLDRRG